MSPIFFSQFASLLSSSAVLSIVFSCCPLYYLLLLSSLWSSPAVLSIVFSCYSLHFPLLLPLYYPFLLSSILSTPAVLSCCFLYCPIFVFSPLLAWYPRLVSLPGIQSSVTSPQQMQCAGRGAEFLVVRSLSILPSKGFCVSWDELKGLIIMNILD